MLTVHKTKIMPYSAEQMYNLVNDIDNYHSFIPHCYKSEIVRQDEHEMIGSMSICVVMVSFTFITKNILEKNKSIRLELEKGPFSDLKGEWQFTSLSQQECQVDFDLSFEFNNGFTKKILQGVFNKFSNELMETFYNRAIKVYGQHH